MNAELIWLAWQACGFDIPLVIVEAIVDAMVEDGKQSVYIRGPKDITYSPNYDAVALIENGRPTSDPRVMGGFERWALSVKPDDLVRPALHAAFESDEGNHWLQELLRHELRYRRR